MTKPLDKAPDFGDMSRNLRACIGMVDALHSMTNTLLAERDRYRAAIEEAVSDLEQEGRGGTAVALDLRAALEGRR